jgi:putative sigma-54 modulation protein
MRVYTTCRNFRITPALKRQLEDRLAKLERYSFVREAHVVLVVQKFRHTAEFVLKTNDKEVLCREESKDMASSIDTAVLRLERQLKKVKEKRSTRLLHDGTRTNGDEAKGAVRSAARIALGSPTGLGAEGRRARATSPDVDEVDAGEAPALIAETARLRKLTPAEAGTVLLAGSDAFLAFLNAETDDLNVIHRRKDGRLGWVAPAGRRRPRS